MVIRLTNAVIDSVEETETRRLKLLKVSSKGNGAILSLELPPVLTNVAYKVKKNSNLN